MGSCNLSSPLHEHTNYSRTRYTIEILTVLWCPSTHTAYIQGLVIIGIDLKPKIIEIKQVECNKVTILDF